MNMEAVEYPCTYCCKSFLWKANAARHMKTCRSNIGSEVVTPVVEHPCTYCCKTFLWKTNATRHIKTCRSNKEHNIGSEEAAVGTKIEVVEHRCTYCCKTFPSLGNLNRHSKKCSSTKHDHTFALKYKCPICGTNLPSTVILRDHYQSDHKIDLSEKQLKFETLAEFLSWKAKFEQDTTSQFVKTSGAYEGKDGVQINKYVCHRSGYFKSKGKKVRNIKTNESNKIGSYCPARIFVYASKKGVKTKYIDTHVGHAMEMGRLLISQSEKRNIAQKLRLKIPRQDILDVSVVPNNRIHLVTRHDIRNIGTEFNLNHDSVLHKDENASLDAAVCYMKSASNTIRLYKPQGETTEEYPQLALDDFVLIIMTDYQLEMLHAYGEECVYIDGTHGLNKCDFQIYSLMVIDDTKQGYACCFLFSNKGDAVAMEIFFKTIKSCLNKPIVPNTFMSSDIDDIFYNAWCRVMSPVQHRFYYCSWRVERAWKDNLSKIKTKAKRDFVNKKLKSLQYQSDIETFENILHLFFKELVVDPCTTDFANYFSKYLKNYHSWAHCYRNNCDDINTNMFVENLHGVLKYIYCDDKKVIRVDNAVYILMKFIRDGGLSFSFDIGIVSYKLDDIRTKHKKSRNLIGFNEDSSKALENIKRSLVEAFSKVCDMADNLEQLQAIERHIAQLQTIMSLNKVKT